MDGFPREFLPSKGHQTLKDVQIPIPISNDQSLLEQPYTFEFLYNSVDSPFIDFSNSYLELWLKVHSQGGEFGYYTGADSDAALTHKPAYAISNLYSIIDKITIDMMYVSPAGQDISVNYSESSIESSRARKFVILKELSKDEIDKSMYAACETLYSRDMTALKYMHYTTNKEKIFQVFIPLMLITGLGTFDCAIKVKTLKMQFVTNYVKNFIGSSERDNTSKIFKKFALNKVYINFRQIYDINFGNDPKALIKCIPNNCQISTYNTLVASSSTAADHNFLVNRSVNFVPDYAMLYFTNDEKSMIPINNETITTIQFQIGGQNIYSKTDFPICFKSITPTASGDSLYQFKRVPNTMFYNIWRSNSNPQSPLNGDEWYNQPIYLFPISSVVDVNTKSGCEVNIQFTVSWCGNVLNLKPAIDKDKSSGAVTNNHTGKTDDGVSDAIPAPSARNIYAHFIFVKFVRDGAMN